MSSSKETANFCYFLAATKFNKLAIKHPLCLKYRKCVCKINFLTSFRTFFYKTVNYSVFWTSPIASQTVFLSFFVFLFFGVGWRRTRWLTGELWLCKTAQDETGANDEQGRRLHVVVCVNLDNYSMPLREAEEARLQWPYREQDRKEHRWLSLRHLVAIITDTGLIFVY